MPSLSRPFLFLACALLAACRAEPAPPLDQQVYIWQQRWLPAHREALATSHADFSTLRILALRAHPRAGLLSIDVDAQALRDDARPRIAVVRLDGSLASLDDPALLSAILALPARWQALGLPLAGLEIDYDCASARLPDYAQWLARLRQVLPAQLPLSLTALPAWLGSPALPTLLAAAESNVLQVHAVDDPAHGLLDERRALDWARRWGQVSPRPFYLALPAYGVALLPDSQDGTRRVESEVPLDDDGPRQELMADPQRLAALLHTLRGDPPAHLAGVLWFRLPLPGDRRAWSLDTLRAVAAGQALHSGLRVDISQQANGLAELQLANPGNLDVPLPASIRLSAEGCTAADALVGYRLQREPGHLTFTRQAEARLAAGAHRPLGWARCQNLQGATLHEPG